MAISNRHIPRKFDIFSGPKGNNVITMCGARTLSRLAGVPGITAQPDKVYRASDAAQLSGWCLICAREAIKFIAEIKKQDSGLEALQIKVMDKCWDVLEQNPPGSTVKNDS